MNKILFAGLIAALVTTGAGCFHDDAPRAYYKTELKAGETVWDACRRITTNEENINEMVYETLKASGIKDASKVQPGQKLTIPVRLRE